MSFTQYCILQELNNHIKDDVFRLGWHKQQTATSARSRNNWHTYKGRPRSPGNGFSRAFESRFLVTKHEAQYSYFRPLGPFS